MRRVITFYVNFPLNELIPAPPVWRIFQAAAIKQEPSVTVSKERRGGTQCLFRNACKENGELKD